MDHQEYSDFSIKQIAQTSPQKIAQILQQKQQIIQSMSHQITKYKADELKLKKSIKQLQDKIQKLSPCNNTTSNFMLPSQFKSSFQQFMTNNISTTFGQLIQSPLIYKKLVRCTFNQVYKRLDEGIKEKLLKIIQIFNLKQQYSQELYQYLLPFLQNHSRQITFNKYSKIRFNCMEENILQLQQSDDFAQFVKELENLCTYMLLQQKPWQFVFINPEIIKFQKKQHTCIDGWLKEGQNAITILKGLKKQNHFHPNLKNYVIPIEQQDSLQEQRVLKDGISIFYQPLQIEPCIQSKKGSKIQLKSKHFESAASNNDKTQIIQELNQQNVSTTNKMNNFQTGSKEYKEQNKQRNVLGNKLTESVNFQYRLRTEIKTQKSQALMFESKEQNTFQQNQKSYDAIDFDQNKENLNSNKKKTKSKQNKDKIGFIKKKKDRNASVIDHTNTNKKNKQQKNIFVQQCLDDLLGVSKNNKKCEDLPVNRQLKNMRKSSKLNAKSSRKCSVGKIVNQSNQFFPSQKSQKVIISQVSTFLLKQNLIRNQNTRQKMYSQAINKKLCEKLDKMIQKQKNIKNVEKDFEKILKAKQKKERQQTFSKEDRVMKLRQEKPLRNGVFTGKLRQKYLN